MKQYFDTILLHLNDTKKDKAELTNNLCSRDSATSVEHDTMSDPAIILVKNVYDLVLKSSVGVRHWYNIEVKCRNNIASNKTYIHGNMKLSYPHYKSLSSVKVM
ncbi:hypothetical protein RND81_03G241000 [Saponaria officinalis]|uniref:Uncharacterized protein n=1 Tax=Saponaria officinalis TaxID=3572 RepID=A0AAW1M2P3_SAPOF